MNIRYTNALVAILATTLTAVSANAAPTFDPGEVGFKVAPPLEPASTRNLLAVTGNTIGGPGGMTNLPVGEELALLGFSHTVSIPYRLNICVTVLNIGGGTVNYTLYGKTSNLNAFVDASETRVLCSAKVSTVRADCQGPGVCNFEWRIDSADVQLIDS